MSPEEIQQRINEEIAREQYERDHLRKDAKRFVFMCKLHTENPARFRKMMSHALELDEYRQAVDEEKAKWTC